MAPSEDDNTKSPEQGRPGSDVPHDNQPSEETEADSLKRPEDDQRAATSGAPELVRRFFWLDPDMNQRLHQVAAEGERSESEIVRELLRAHYGLD